MNISSDCLDQAEFSAALRERLPDSFSPSDHAGASRHRMTVGFLSIRSTHRRLVWMMTASRNKLEWMAALGERSGASKVKS